MRTSGDNDLPSWVDAAGITEFEGDEDNNLYKLWNRMSSGSYFPSHGRPVRGHGFLQPMQLMTL